MNDYIGGCAEDVVHCLVTTLPDYDQFTISDYQALYFPSLNFIKQPS